MGLQGTIQSLVGTAFDVVGDLKETVDYIHEGTEPDYDVTQGLVTPDAATVTVQVRAMLVPFETVEDLPTALVKEALPGDQVALVPGIDFNGKALNTGDKIVRKDDTWLVKGFVRDPAEGLFKVLVGRVGGGADGAMVFHNP